MDSACLQFLAAARFSALEVTVNAISMPFQSPTGTLPGYISPEGEQIVDFEKFVIHLRKQHDGIQLDSELTDEQKTQFNTYEALLNSHLIPALEDVFFMDEFNYSAFMVNWYSNYVTFPMNIYYLNKRKNCARKRVKLTNRTSTELLNRGINVLNMLSAKRGESKYFFGSKPCSFDAMIFGYIAPLLKIPLANNKLQLHLSSLPNLTLFIESVINIYLPLSIDEVSYQVQQHTKWMAYADKGRRRLQYQKAAQQLEKIEREKAEKSANNKVIVFSMLSLMASVLFALHTGIVQVQSEHKHYLKRKR
ncbi:unnamed protein product [Bursaphelenchus xylophilus]|uniref:(pine wood nematode) hypothetical protein n=1 Tax=Bursaphelenchus xylophilus TaxID=6326 RepID=A0A1I7SPX9_BURXY|nr:unnamed protein product [Bursaphelenchus xylophilus]CAG9109344.1 unnamed protein product [Bursaphelenchus xylophilus]